MDVESHRRQRRQDTEGTATHRNAPRRDLRLE